MHGLHGALAVRVRGQVQGVGFRPFVWQLATRLGLRGEVLNDPEGVLIHVTGIALPAFLAALRDEAPPLAHIDAVETAPHRFDQEPAVFAIVPSRGVGTETRVTPDAATCPACAEEIRDPAQRRFGYAFTNCTHCGPRLSILSGLPYDRARTSMAAFAMCADCAQEYADPADRRFHAQPIACPACGPRLWLERDGQDLQGDPIALAADLLCAGRIIAIKGLGGFHLACDATDPEAVATLRRRKRRPTKPFALMAPHALIRAHAEVMPEEEALLSDPAAPVVLLAKAAAPLPEALAPGQPTLGWMLPYTPLHHLLLDAVKRPLVMTSGNLSGEPQVIANDEAREKLSVFADAFLLHDRDIRRRLDDGVERWTRHGPVVLRRGRGRVPATQPLPPGFEGAPPVLSFGGQLKSSICLTKNGQALLSHHLGDLDDLLTWEEFLKADADYAALFDHLPEAVACDLHPGYRSSIHARGRGLPLVEVQHHHAHLASCLGENRWPRDAGPVAGIVLDGLGLGLDGTVWGGELLVGDYAGFARAAYLAPAPLLGGDAAQREPWRNALVRLDRAGLPDLADRLFPDRPRDLLRQAARAGINAPLSSSAGRLFDSVAALLGFGDAAQSFEGEAAMLVEALALAAPEGFAEPYPFAVAGQQMDPSPAFRAIALDLAQDVPPECIAARFQSGLARTFCAQARGEVEAGRARAVALTGGCFQNATLLDLCLADLAGLRVLIHHQVPTNDGGLALGQALVAAARLAESA